MLNTSGMQWVCSIMFHSFVEFHVLLLLKLSESESYAYLWTEFLELCHWTADVWTATRKS